MRRFNVTLLIAICANAGIAWQAFGQATEGNVKPEDVLRQLADYYGKLPAFSCKVESTLDITAQGQSNKNTSKVTVRFERPNKFAFILDKGVMGLTTVSDGKKATQYFPAMKRYAVKEVPEDLTELFDFGVPVPITMLGMNGDWIPTSGDELFKRLTDGVTESKYLGQEKVGEVECHHLRFVQEEFDWDIWIQVGKTPLVQKIVPDLAKQLASAGAQFQNTKLGFTVTFSDWNVAPKFTPADFEFTPPAVAQKVDELFAPPEEPPHPLLGQAAPAFITEDLEGHPIDLKKNLGKNVIMLDFWATWCGPCIQAMPQVDAVAKQFAPQGLVFYAVNAGEEPAAIKEFFTTSKMEVPVALDQKNEIGPLYNVEGIPQTVLIGKDGKVQVVHIGFNNQLGKLLTKDIEALLAGKDLAAVTLAKYAESQKNQEASDGGEAETGDAAAQTPAAEEAAPAKP
jgi:peroxiredoxin